MKTINTPKIEIIDDGQMYISAWKVTGKREEKDELEDLGYYASHEKAIRQAEFWERIMKWSETKISHELIWL